MGCCLTRAELLQEGVRSHLQSSRAGEAPTQGDVTGHDSAEAWHGTTCRTRRKEGRRGAASPCRAVCAPQLTGEWHKEPLCNIPEHRVTHSSVTLKPPKHRNLWS